MTARKILDYALDLINQRSEDGEYTPYIADYEKNVLSYINILTISLYELDCRLKGITCNIDEVTPKSIESLDETPILHEAICKSALVYGLAFMLLLEEEPERAERFHALYKEECMKLEKMSTVCRRRPITEVY